jgi:hypothetical protein
MTKRSDIVITPQMIEAGAAALRDVVVNRSGRGKPWDQLPDNIRAMYRAEAEACLQAGLAIATATTATSFVK